MAKEKLQTVDIPGVEIMAVGTWQGYPSAATYTQKDLDALVDSFVALTGDKKLNFEPPVKLGHAANQKLLQEDGYPAAGWVSALKRVGDKLVADFKAVPKAIADIISAGGYKKVSSEIYSDYSIAGKKFPLALKAVALLGGDIPAVKTIQDIQALYAAEHKPEFTTVIFEESLDDQTRKVRDAWDQQTCPSPAPVARCESNGWVSKVYPDRVIIEKGGKLYQAPYSEDASGNISFDLSNVEEVEEIYQVKTPAAEPSASPEAYTATAPAAGGEAIKNNNTEVLMEKELRTLLGLDEKGDVVAAVTALKAKADSVTTTLAEHEDTRKKLVDTEVKLSAAITKLAENDRDNRVSKALADRKITPAQKAWADDYAMKDPAGFAAFVEAAKPVVELGERGTSGGETGATQFTETELSIASKMGISKEDLAKYGKEAK